VRRYLLDSALVAALLHNRPAAVTLVRPWLFAHEAATSILVYGEVVEYIKTRPNFLSHHRGLRALLGEVYPYFVTYPILERYADLRLGLRKPHGPGLIGDIDTLIAATALERRLTVVTTDHDFSRVPRLSVMLLDRAALSTVRQP
jgi:predicted nucleic acid-binding protein